MIMRYQSGEEIKKGDRVLFHGEPGEIEFVAVDPDDPEMHWYLQEYGGGIMIVEPKFFGRAFIPAGQIDELEGFLELVSRAQEI